MFKKSKEAGEEEKIHRHHIICPECGSNWEKDIRK